MNEFSRVEPQNPTAFPIAKAGWPYIFVATFTTGVFALLDFAVLSILGLIVLFFICWFFRDPDRVIPNRADAVVSPADGKIIFASEVDNGPFIDGKCFKISIFMNIFNVHVNRAPYDGVVKHIDYYPGKFFSANLDKASKENEHNVVHMETDEGDAITFVQIAGLIARRIICVVQEKDNLVRGGRFGMICFGSRVDIYLPSRIRLNVSIGEKVRGGTDILAFLNNKH